MKVIFAVLHDLYVFTFVYGFGLLSSQKKNDTQKAVESFTNVATKVPVQQPLGGETTKPLLAQPTPPLLGADTSPAHDGVGYALAPETLLHALPARTFDGVIDRLPYGASFEILNMQGKWCNVRHGDVRGWIHNDNVTKSQAELNPHFALGERYDSENPNTIKLRTVIDDAFHAAPLDAPLQDVEYVAYKLMRKGRTVVWPKERPRIAGTWQRILKGAPGIHIGINPKTGSVMEYVLQDNTGHVVYVDSVFPDGGIAISEVGFPTEAVYSERVLAGEVWRELRPVFIDVS